MKIRSLDVDGFGVWHGLKFERLSDTVTVIYGPNEAGKTTLMQFVRAMLYGFTPERRARYLPPIRGGRGGGTLQLAGPRGDSLLTRYDDPTLSLDGQVRLVPAAGNPYNDATLGSYLANVDEPTFRNVFAVGMREISELASLSDSASAEKLYRVATGLGRISLAELLRELTASRQRLFTPDAPSSQIAQLADQRQRLANELERLRDLGPEYLRLASDRTKLTDELAAIDAQQAECQRRIDWLEKAEAARDPWQKRAAVRAELERLEGLAKVPADALERFETLTKQAKLWRRREKQATKLHAKLRKDLQEVAVAEPLVRQGPRIEALTEQRTWLSSLATDVDRLATQIEQATKQLADEHTSLGIPLPTDGKRGFDTTALDRLKPAYQALRAAQRRRIEAHQEAKRPVDNSGELKKQLEEALKGRGDGDLHAAIEEAGELVSKLRRRVQLDERLAEMSRQQTEIAGQGKEIVDRQLLPPSLLIGLGAIFVLGVVLVLTGLLLPGTILGPAGWTMVGLGIVATVTALGVKFWVEYSAEQELEGAQQRSSQLASQIEQAKTERDALDAKLPRGGGPLLTRLAAAEKDHAELEALLPLHSQHSSVTRKESSAQAILKRAHAEWQAAQQRWKQALTSAGLPAALSLRQMREFMKRRDTLEDSGHAIVRYRQELADRTRDLDTLRNRVLQVASDAQVDLRPLKNAEPVDILDHLQQQWNQQQQLETRRNELRDQQRRAGKMAAKATRQFRRHRDARRALLRGAGARHERHLRDLVAHAARLEAARQEHAGLVAELGRLLTAAEHPIFDDYFTHFSAEDTHREHAQLVDRHAQLQHRSREVAEQRGRADERMRTLAGDRRAADRRVELAAVDEQLREALERWQVLGLTHQVIADLRRRYENEQQPEALREASQYFTRLTEGHYARVWTPVDEDVLRVDDAAGNALPVEVLSRGTREQLFLSLRLALVGLFARQGANLPMVLDDVLVNFDAGRARVAAEVLRDFAAQGHQLLIFTCHEHIAELFRSLGALAIRLPSNAIVNPQPAPIPLPPPAPVVVAEAPPPLMPVAPPPPRRQKRRPQPVERIETVERAPEPERVVPRPHTTLVRQRSGRFVTSNWHESIKETVEVVGGAHPADLNGHDG